MKHLRFILIFVWSIAWPNVSNGQSYKDILHDGHYADLPTQPVNIKSETVEGKSYQPAFLAFEVPLEDAQVWIRNCRKLKRVSVEDVFEENLVIHPEKVPDWFTKLSGEGQSTEREMYAYSQKKGRFFTLTILDIRNNRVLIQSLRR